MVKPVVRSAAWLSLACGLACTPAFDENSSKVSSPEILAVQGTPTEGPLGAAFALTALYVDSNGPRDPSEIDWATCLRQKPLGEPDPVDPGCFVDASPDLVPLGKGGTAKGTIPQTACQLFGPDSPPPAPGQAGTRPTDPDTTGGFYLPIRVKSPEGEWSVALERIACPPSGLTQGVFLAFTSGYHVNTTPTLSELARVDGTGVAIPLTPDPVGSDAGASPAIRIAAGEQVNLRATWPTCSGDEACGGAESYLFIDPTSKQVTTRRESMVASWYATGGGFDETRNGRGEADPVTNVANRWTAPSDEETVHLWVVLRDARGGVGWGSYTIGVHP